VTCTVTNGRDSLVSLMDLQLVDQFYFCQDPYELLALSEALT